MLNDTHPDRATLEGRLEADVLETVRSVALRKTYPAGATLIQQGEVEHTFFVIESGEAAVSRHIEGESEVALNTLGPAQFFGEMGLLDDRPRMATVRASSTLTVLEINEERFEALMAADPRLARHITRRVLASMRQIDQQNIRELQSRNVLLQQAYLNLQAAQAQLVEKERLERELELAAEVQRDLLPSHLPQPPGYRFSAFLSPARSVGGDLYDVIQLDADHIGILIADVADKGLHAALMMAVTRALFFQEAKRTLSPMEVACCVHEALMTLSSARESGRDAFVTAFYGVLHLPTGIMRYVRAAHERPLLVRPGSPPAMLPGGGRFLGMIDELTLAEYEVALLPGDCLLLFSDGLTDAQNEAQACYGHDRLAGILASVATLDADEVVRAIIADVASFTGDADPFDDMALLAVKVGHSPEAA